MGGERVETQTTLNTAAGRSGPGPDEGQHASPPPARRPAGPPEHEGRAAAGWRAVALGGDRAREEEGGVRGH